jgi:phosphoserine aminotransferase
MNVSFYPGPSQLYPEVEQYLTDAYRSGILSMNHRSPAFMDLLAQTVAALREKLALPPDYEVYFTSSATECWEIIAQSLLSRQSLHAFNGAFGQKWYEYTQRIRPDSVALPFGVDEPLDVASMSRGTQADVLCLTHNETSNATAIFPELLLAARRSFAGVIAVDATSSMAGVALPWEAADAWFASVQKCFGLPPGLGVLIVSPRAVEQAQRVADRRYYNSLLFVRENFLKNQTPYTPNTLAIYLLSRVMQQVPPIGQIDAQTRQRAKEWYAFLSDLSVDLLVQNEAVRSDTVVAFRGEASFIAELKTRALAEGIVLGNGYGEWKNASVRIANFPAITEKAIQRLRIFLKNNIPDLH